MRLDDSYPGETSLKSQVIWKFITTPIQRLDEAYALKLMSILYERNQKIPFPMPPNYRDNEIDKLEKEREQIPRLMIGARWFTPGLWPSIFPGRIETYRRERIIALALAAYRTRYHRYPSTLKSLEAFWGSAMPKDLYGGKSFRYHSDGKTFKLYSVGLDRVDNGGRSDTYPSNDDIEWMNTSPAM